MIGDAIARFRWDVVVLVLVGVWVLPRLGREGLSAIRWHRTDKGW